MTISACSRSALPLALLLCATAPAAGDEDQRPRPTVGAPDEARAFDRSYFELAAATGGDFYFWAPGEFGTVLAMPLLGDETVVLAHGELAGAREIELPVDGGLRRLDVFAGVQARARLELLGPDGEPAADGRAGVTLQRTRLMLLASIDDPAPGTWTLRLGGKGLFSTSARGLLRRAGEPVSFLGFEHVELRGRPGHEGLFERRLPPEPGSEGTCRVGIEGAVGPLSVDFLKGDGTPLGLEAEPLEASAEARDGEWLATCRVPAVPHRVRVRGRDAAGRAFQRVEPGLRGGGL